MLMNASMLMNPLSTPWLANTNKHSLCNKVLLKYTYLYKLVPKRYYSQTNSSYQTRKQFHPSNRLTSSFQILNHFWYYSLSIYLIQNFIMKIKVLKNNPQLQFHIMSRIRTKLQLRSQFETLMQNSPAISSHVRDCEKTAIAITI